MGVPVIRAGRTLSDRNGAIIRGSRDVKRSALCARRPCEKVAVWPPIRFCRHRPKYRSPYNLTSNYSSLMPRERFSIPPSLSLLLLTFSSHRFSLFPSRVFYSRHYYFFFSYRSLVAAPPLVSRSQVRRAIILSRLPANRQRRIVVQLSESGPAFENTKLSVFCVRPRGWVTMFRNSRSPARLYLSFKESASVPDDFFASLKDNAPLIFFHAPSKDRIPTQVVVF